MNSPFSAAPELSVILPTYNERANVRPTLQQIDAGLTGAGIGYEIIVVDDDSPDGTWAEVENEIKARKDLHLIRRIGRRGLSSAVVEGFSAARGRLLVVLDADLQHDASILPAMVEAAKSGSVQLVVATRYGAGGSTGDWRADRRWLSRLATLLSRLVVKTQVSDPMSGYFLVTSSAWQAVRPRLNPRGFKILLEVIGRSAPLEFREIGYTFQARLHGESKLDGDVRVDYLKALYDLSLGRWLPLRLLLYCLVGASGLVVNLGVLWLLDHRVGLAPTPSLLGAIAVSMVSNFVLNNLITFRDRRHRGWWSLLAGLGLFALICSAGALINFSVAHFFRASLDWNLYAADLAGIVIATAWNFTLNRRVTWRKVESYF